MVAIHKIRFGIYGGVLFLSILVLALGAYFASFHSFLSVDSVFTNLALATSVITFAILIPLLALDYYRAGHYGSMVAVELGWLGFLWILWLASAGEAAEGATFFSDCNADDTFDDTFDQEEFGFKVPNCNIFPAIVVFSFLNWAALLGWWITLMYYAIRGRHWYHFSTDDGITVPYTVQPATFAPQMTGGHETSQGYPPQQPQMGYTGSPYAAGTPAKEYPNA